MARKLQPFPWYGGKHRTFDFLLKHMPKENHHFVDVFGGSGVVLLNKPSARFDTYNDIDSDLVNFFQVLRDDGDALIRLLTLTPYSREECNNCYAKRNDLTISSLERARMFYCRARFSFAGMAQSSISSYFTYSTNVADERSDRMPIKVSAFINSVDKLPEIVNRLRKVQIENEPALDILKRYDTTATFFYLDPPYVHKTRQGGLETYKGEMSDAEHETLATALHAIKGKAMVSGYKGELYDRLFATWRRVDEAPKCSTTAKKIRQESIWMNYAAQVASPVFPFTLGRTSRLTRAK